MKRLVGRVVARVGLLSDHIRGQVLRLKSHGQIAADFRAGAGVRLHTGRLLNASVESYVGEDVHFVLGPEGVVTLGRNVWISRGGHVCANQAITIGDDVMVGEFTSIRDTTHSLRRTEVPMKRQGDTSGRVEIGSDVWIGRGCLLQSQGETLSVGDGAVIAAHSVVTHSVPPYEIWGGTPARFLRVRADSDET